MSYTFRKSTKKHKKYDAVFANGKVVSFGDDRYQQYKDSTGLGLYSYLDHLDLKRRKSFRARHGKDAKVTHSAAWFAYKYLW